ncbi:RICIN domain-containing protein [Streptomyces sp. NPDC002588]|uniref:RICIN domain-containing protein n=1 Tax=Streptomyces sp. NPDC002588 TaxID=3154419 RepID=UPI003322516D
MTTFISLEPTGAAVDPGSSATATLRLRNDGDTVEEYRLSVVGDPAEWTRIAPDTLRLYPGEEGSAEVVFAPPRSAGTTAGTVRFGVLVRPRENPELSNVAEGTLAVSAFGEMRAELLPVTVRGRLSGRPRVAVDNLGNSPLPARVSGQDDEDALTFRPVPETVLIAQGRTRLARVRVRPSGVKLFGRPERYPFALTVTPTAEETPGTPAGPGTPGVAPPAQLRGTFVRLPLFPKWLLVLLGLLLAAAGVSAALWFVPRPSLVSNAVAQQQPAVAPPTALPPAPASQAPPPVPSPPAAAPSPSPSQSEEQQQEQQQQQDGDQAQNAGEQATDEAGNTVVTIRSVQNDKDLTVQDGRTDDGTPVVVSDWTNRQQGLNQFWAQLPFADGTVALTPGSSPGSVLDRADGQALVRIRSVQGGDDAVRQGQVPPLQRWRLQTVSDGVVTIVNAQTGECLTNTGDDTQVQAVACDDRFAPLQQWRLGNS